MITSFSILIILVVFTTQVSRLSISSVNIISSQNPKIKAIHSLDCELLFIVSTISDRRLTWECNNFKLINDQNTILDNFNNQPDTGHPLNS